MAVTSAGVTVNQLLSGQVPGVNHPAYNGNSSVPTRMVGTAHNYYSSPGRNWYSSQAARPQPNMVVAVIPQRQLPEVNSPAPTYRTPRRPRRKIFNSDRRPCRRNGSRTADGNPAQYNALSRSAPAHANQASAAAPQGATPANTQSGSQSSQSGNHGGNSGSPGH